MCFEILFFQQFHPAVDTTYQRPRPLKDYIPFTEFHPDPPHQKTQNNSWRFVSDTPQKLTCPLKNSDWKTIDDVLNFSGGPFLSCPAVLPQIFTQTPNIASSKAEPTRNASSYLGIGVPTSKGVLVIARIHPTTQDTSGKGRFVG